MTFAQPFSNYEILARIGSGAMGTVFKARQKHMNRIVALKVLKPSLARDTRYVERLQREARIVGKLNHPNIVTGYDLGQEGGYHFFVMEFVEGKSLRQLLQEWGMFPEEQVLELAIQVADALAHAYDCGVIHRDVKPGNILIDQDGRAKLTDMGLAKVETDLALTKEGATVGTPQYISPEQARDPQRADIRSDLYSLGATLFHMATGQPPFKADSIGELITKVLHERPASAVELNPALSDGLSLVIRKLLAKDPSLRYQTPRELLTDLRRVTRRERPDVDRGALEADEEVENPRSAVTSGARPGVWIAAVAGTVAVAVAVALAFGGGGGEDASPGGVDRFRRELGEQLARTQSFRSRFEIIREARATTTAGERVAVLADEERRLGLELGRELEAAIGAWVEQRRGETERWLREADHWRDSGTFVREEVVPDLEARFGYRPDELPTADLRGVVSTALAGLGDELVAMGDQRDEEFLRRHARYLRDELRDEVLALARAGELRGALDHLRDGLDAFFGVDGRPTRSQLPEPLVAKVLEAEGAAERAIGAEIRDAQNVFLRALEVEAERGFEVLDRLRADLAATGSAPGLLREAVAELERRLARHHAASSEWIAGTTDPWPGIEARLRAARVEVDVLQRRFEQQVLDEELDLAYRVLVEDGPTAAASVLSGASPSDGDVAARRDRHVEAFDSAARFAAQAYGALPGSRVPLANGAEARIERDDGTVTAVRDADGRRIPSVRVEFELVLARLPASVRAEIDGDRSLRIGRALLALGRGDHATAVALVDAGDREFLEQDVWPRVRAAAGGAASEVESEARAALGALLRAREADDVDAVRSALSAFDARFDGTTVAAETARLRADAAEWVRAREARDAFAVQVRERVPSSFAIEFAEGGVVRVSGTAGDLPAAQRPPGWTARGAELAWAGSEERAAPIDLGLPIPDPVAVRASFELRLGDRGAESQLVVLQFAGAPIAIIVLPLGQVAAVLLEEVAVLDRPDELRRALAGAIAVALDSPPALVHGAWHRVTVRADRRRGGGLDVTLWWDGRDGRRLVEGRVASKVADSRVRIVPFQPTGVRALEIECTR